MASLTPTLHSQHNLCVTPSLQRKRNLIELIKSLNWNLALALTFILTITLTCFLTLPLLLPLLVAGGRGVPGQAWCAAGLGLGGGEE